MAGKASRTGPSEPDPATSEPSAAEAPEVSSDNADDAALKTEEGELPAIDADATSNQPQATEAENAKPSTDTAHDDAASRGSSESDDKAATSSPSKKASGRSKKGGRNSRGKSTSSKRSSEEQEATKDDTAQVSETVDPSDSTTDANTEAEANNAGAAPAAESTETEPQPTSAPDAAGASESTSAATNGHDDAPPKNASGSKELAQLGLGSFGDGADDEVVGPRRSRRGPGASPDPKARVPKTEPDSDITSLQDTSAAEQADPTANPDNLDDATSSAEDSKTAAAAPSAPEEVADEAPTEAKTEAEDDHQNLTTEAEAAPGPNLNHEESGVVEEGEVDLIDADENGDVDGEEGGDEGVTRCVCGSADENVGLMIQCETCKCWQHCVCMGMQVEEDCPDVYFCEQCRPELHIPLLRSLGLLPKASKKGSGKGAKYSARELKEAKDAIAMLAQENARRTQAAEAAAAYNSRDRKGSANRNDASKEVPKSPKRRSTMNSRDSAYGGWEPIPPGLLADGEVWEGADDRKGGKKRKRGLPDDHMDSAAETPGAGEGAADLSSDASKRRRMSAGTGLEHDGEADMDEDDLSGGADHSASASSRDKGSKKKKGNNQYTVREASVTADSSASKPRHPNQYTYRNKDRNGAVVGNGQKTGSSSTSNLTSHSPSPSPSKGRAENARRAAARDNGSQIGTPAPGEFPGSSGRGNHSTSSTQWGLPEHLTHLAYLLPNAGSRSYKSSGLATENGSANGGKKGSANSSGGPSPPGGSSFPTPFQVLSSIESSTKVRFPSRRMTMGEMRKRVRNIGEYVTRSQIEAVERERRMKLLGIVPPYMDELEQEIQAEAEAMQEEDAKDASASTAEATTEPGADAEAKEGAANAKAQSKVEQLPLSMRLMEELTRELIHFQRKFGIGPGSYGSLGNSHQSASVN